MKLVYIAGPYLAGTAWDVEQNIRRAEDAAYMVLKCGAMPVCPHTNTRGYFQGVASDEQILKGTLELLRRCDAILLIEEWQSSAGSIGEQAEAERLGLAQFRERDWAILKDWVKDEEREEDER